MAHCISAAAEALLDVEMPVLDHGAVTLIDYMGGDLRIVEAARVSYVGGTTHSQTPEQLINYLLSSGHTSPFEQAVLTAYLRLPIFTMRELVRHRVARLNETSARYSVLPNMYYIPGMERIMGQDTVNKQGSVGLLPEAQRQLAIEVITNSTKTSREAYEWLLAAGVAREIARCVMPVNQYTCCFWQMDLHNLMHFLYLRLDWHAQWEIRQYAEKLALLVEAVCPMTWKAFMEHKRDAVKISSTKAALVQEFMGMLRGGAVYDDRRLLALTCQRLSNKRERREFLSFMGLLEGDIRGTAATFHADPGTCDAYLKDAFGLEPVA